MSLSLRVASLVARTSCEGPGERFALWVAGCSLRCPGCCNPELFDADAGQEREVDALVETIVGEHARRPLEGVSVLGGEPLEQLGDLTALCQHLRRRAPELGIIVFSGWTAAQLRGDARVDPLRRLVDTIVAGPFDATALEPIAEGRRFIGSTNQTLEHFSERYADRQLWRGPAQAELRVDRQGRLSVHGEPELSRRLRRRLRLVPAG